MPEIVVVQLVGGPGPLMNCLLRPIDVRHLPVLNEHRFVCDFVLAVYRQRCLHWHFGCCLCGCGCGCVNPMNWHWMSHRDFLLIVLVHCCRLMMEIRAEIVGFDIVAVSEQLVRVYSSLSSMLPMTNCCCCYYYCCCYCLCLRRCLQAIYFDNFAADAGYDVDDGDDDDDAHRSIYRDPMLLDCWRLKMLLAMNHLVLVLLLLMMMSTMIRLSMMVNWLEVGERMELYPIFACHVCVERRFSVLTVQGIHRD